MTVTISFLGAAEGVTGSRHLLDVDGTRILVDCGLFQGRRREARERNLVFPIDAAGIHNVVLTHAHIDHSGALPILVRNGFTGHIYCTRATRDLAKILLRDSGHIQEKDADHLNKQLVREARRKNGGKPNGEPIEPLYTALDAEAVDSHFHGIAYHEEVEIGPGIRMSMTDQGHILGAGAALVSIDRPSGATMRVLFSGDRGRRGMPILRDPEPYPECDWLLTESTYGGRIHDPTGDMPGQLEKVVREVIDSAGRLIIPAFSVGRTQNIVYYLHELVTAGRLPRLPVFIDSPLSLRATRVYMDHPECFDEDTTSFLADPDGRRFDYIRYTESVEESKAINEAKGPMIVISASGMCESGRILHHLKHGIEDERNTVLIVGWMGEHTLGRRLKEKANCIHGFD